MPRFAAVYRHFDSGGRLLYVGCSINPFMRLRAHEWAATWAMDIASVTVEWFPCESAAYKAEAKAIAREHPIHNRLPRKAKATLIEAKGATVEECRPEKPPAVMGSPRKFNPTPEQDAAIRAVWLDEARSLADRCQGVMDIYGAKVNRFTLYRMYGKPGAPRKEADSGA